MFLILIFTILGIETKINALFFLAAITTIALILLLNDED